MATAAADDKNVRVEFSRALRYSFARVAGEEFCCRSKVLTSLQSSPCEHSQAVRAGSVVPRLRVP